MGSGRNNDHLGQSNSGTGSSAQFAPSFHNLQSKRKWKNIVDFSILASKWKWSEQMGRGFAKQKKQARALQEKFAKMQEELSSVEAEGQAGNGLVRLKLNGDHQLVELKIKPECVDPEDIEGLEDLVRAAHAEAVEKLREETAGGIPDMGSLGGMLGP
jgi:nucleoid-associated protein EbfC